MEDPGLEPEKADLGEGRTSGAPLAYTNLLENASLGVDIGGPRAGLKGAGAIAVGALGLGGSEAPLA